MRRTPRWRSENLQDAHAPTIALTMAIGLLLLAVGSYLGGKDHGIGAIVTADDFPSARLSFDLVAAGGVTAHNRGGGDGRRPQPPRSD